MNKTPSSISNTTPPSSQQQQNDPHTKRSPSSHPQPPHQPSPQHDPSSHPPESYSQYRYPPQQSLPSRNSHTDEDNPPLSSSPRQDLADPAIRRSEASAAASRWGRGRLCPIDAVCVSHWLLEGCWFLRGRCRCRCPSRLRSIGGSRWVLRWDRLVSVQSVKKRSREALLLTEQLQQVLQEWNRVVVLDETEQEASVHKIVTSHELGGDVFLHVQVFEVDIVWKQMLCWSLMQCDVETFQCLGIGVVFSSL
jgi:hypothetical protein